MSRIGKLLESNKKSYKITLHGNPFKYDVIKASAFKDNDKPNDFHYLVIAENKDKFAVIRVRKGGSMTSVLESDDLKQAEQKYEKLKKELKAVEIDSGKSPNTGFLIKVNKAFGL